MNGGDLFAEVYHHTTAQGKLQHGRVGSKAGTYNASTKVKAAASPRVLAKIISPAKRSRVEWFYKSVQV